MKTRFPAEWEPHEATWLGWPHNESDFPGCLSTVQGVFRELITELTKNETVHLICENEEEAREALKNITSNIEFHQFRTNRGWLRDSAPTFCIADHMRVQINWNFNAWAKYDDYGLDNKVIELTSRVHQDKVVNPCITLEGGAIETNGEGTLMVTEECLLSDEQCRNPGFTKENYEAVFRDYLGIDNVIWLPSGILGDDTHGHIDDTARFVPGGKVLHVDCTSENPNFERLKTNIKFLENFTEVVPLPIPGPVELNGEMLPASYANFYIANKIVVLPVFNDPNDAEAIKILEQCFPDREIIPLPSRELIVGRGSFHCCTQQVPLL